MAHNSSKAFLLLIIGEPFSESQKDSFICEIDKGIQSWNEESSGCNIVDELEKACSSFAANIENEDGEKMYSHTSEAVAIELLINPTVKVLQNKLKEFFLKEGTYHHLIYAGPFIKNSGKWVLQDSIFDTKYFLDIFQSFEVINAIKDKTISGFVYLNCCSDRQLFDTKVLKSTGLIFKINAKPLKSCGNNETILKNISQHMSVRDVEDLLKSTSVVGNIRFTRPTIYIFPACQGDSALFGINGFNFLIDCGYSKKSCFWNFVRHLDRIDAILVSHLTFDNIFGLESLLSKKAKRGLHLEIGCVFANTVKEVGKFCDENVHSKPELNPIINASNIIQTIKQLDIILKPCFSNNAQPINLYHKVGHGSIDLYVLNPAENSKNLHDFLNTWSKGDDPFVSKTDLCLGDLISVCAILVWKPASPNDTITRLLFPGTVNQKILFEGLDKIKNLPIFQISTCSEKDLSAPVKSAKKIISEKSLNAQSKISSKTATNVSNTNSKTVGTNKKFTSPIKKETSKNNLDNVTREKKDEKAQHFVDVDNKTKDEFVADEEKKDLKIEVQSLSSPEPQQELEYQTNQLVDLNCSDNVVEQNEKDNNLIEISEIENMIESKNVEADITEEIKKDIKNDNLHNNIHNSNLPNCDKNNVLISQTDEEINSKSDVIDSWDKPLGTPPPSKTGFNNTSLSSDRKSTLLAESASSKKPANKYGQKAAIKPIYLDLAYIPHHADPHHIDAEFFKRVRAKYYVLSTVCPDAGVLTALLEGKQTWDDPSLEVTIIPTYDTDVLRYWMGAHKDQLSHLKISVAPAANRCTIHLQDHETSCAAYRMEF